MSSTIRIVALCVSALTRKAHEKARDRLTFKSVQMSALTWQLGSSPPIHGSPVPASERELRQPLCFSLVIVLLSLTKEATRIYVLSRESERINRIAQERRGTPKPKWAVLRWRRMMASSARIPDSRCPTASNARSDVVYAADNGAREFFGLWLLTVGLYLLHWLWVATRAQNALRLQGVHKSREVTDLCGDLVIRTGGL